MDDAAQPEQSTTKSAEHIERWLIDELARILDMPATDIDPSVPFDRYGLDSAAAISLTGDLSDWLGQEVDPSLIYDFPTIETISSALSEGELDIEHRPIR